MPESSLIGGGGINAAAYKLKMSLSLQNGAPEPHFAVGAMTSDLCGLLGHGTVRADQNSVPLGKISCSLVVATTKQRFLPSTGGSCHHSSTSACWFLGVGLKGWWRRFRWLLRGTLGAIDPTWEVVKLTQAGAHLLVSL
eukprot:SAG11_NODE_70_length_18450_cov_14.704975_6_plen_139_part_00